MVAKLKSKKPSIRPRRSSQTMKIAISFLATMFGMDGANVYLGIIGAVTDDEQENVPVIFDGTSGKYVNLSTGELSTLDDMSFAFTSEVWYVPRFDAFIFIVSGKTVASVKRLELIKIFGKEVIINLKVKLR